MKSNMNLAPTSPTNDDGIVTPNPVVSAYAWHESLTEIDPFDKLFRMIPDKNVNRLTFIQAVRAKDHLPEGIVCPICNGYIEINDDTYGQIYCFCYMADWLRDLSVPVKGLRSTMRPNRTLKSLQNKVDAQVLRLKGKALTAETVRSIQDLYNFTSAFLESPLERPLMVISGGTGTGKSHAMEAIANQLGPRMCVYHSGQDWNTFVQNALSQGRLSDFLEALKMFPCYIHDDWGAHHSTSLTDDNLMQVLTTRMNLGLPTVLTTNIPLKDLATLDARVNSRLFGDNVRRLAMVCQDLRPVFE